MRQIRQKVNIEQYRLVQGLMGSYDCVRRVIGSFLFPFPSLLIYRLWQSRRSAPKDGDNETAKADPRPGKHQCI